MNAWLTPDEMPTANRCLTLLIPDSEAYVQILAGTLLNLTYPENYEQYGSVTPEEISRRMSIIYNSLILSLNGECFMIGAMVMFFTPNPPARCLPCEGGIYTGSDYPALYAMLQGSIYDIGNGLFQLPNMRGKFPLGAQSPSFVNVSGGASSVTLQTENLPPHNHTYQGVIPNIDVEAPAGIPDFIAAGINPTPSTTSSVGTGTPFEIMPPYFTIRFAVVAE